MRIAVTAATGNTGVALVQALSQAGHQVVAITRDPLGKAAQELVALPGVEALTLEDAFNKPVDRVYLASAATRDMFVVETDIINAARKAGAKYIVKLATVDSWMHVYNDLFYARSHLAVEHFLEQGDIPFTSLRPNLFHNNAVGLDLASVAKTRQFKTMLHGASVASIDPADVGRAAAALLSLDDPSPHYGQKYTLTGPENIDDQSIGEVLREVLQTDVKFAGGIRDDEFPALFLEALTHFKQGKGDLAHTATSPEILALAPPRSTFKDYITHYFAKRV